MGGLPVEKMKKALEREKSSGVISGGSAVGEPRVHPLDGASKHNPGEDPSREKRVRRSTPDLAPERTLVARSTKTSLIHEAEHRRRRHAFARGHTGHLSRQNAGETPRHKSLDSSFLNNIFSLVADKNRLHDFRDPLLAAGAREHRTACTTGSSSIHD